MGSAPMVTDPPRANYTSKKNPHICNLPIISISQKIHFHNDQNDTIVLSPLQSLKIHQILGHLTY